MQVNLMATARFTYAGKNLRAGDRFAASEKDAKVLKAIKRAQDAPVVVEPRRAVQRVTIAPTAAPVIQPPEANGEAHEVDPEPAADDEPKPKRTYKRKDMTSESDE